MAISNINSQNVPGQARQSTERHITGQSNKQAAEPTSAQKQKASLNASLVKATQVSIGAKDQSLALLLNTAIDKINEVLMPELGEDAIKKVVDSGLDVSPEATAERIVSLSTAFYSAYKEQNPEEGDSVSLENFLDTIESGIDKGFESARDILESMKVLEGDIASNIDETYNLVQDKLAAFKTMLMEQGVKQSLT